MPLKIGVNMSADYFVTAKDLGLEGHSLPVGQGCAVNSSDLETVIITGDATPRNAPNGSESVASGKVTSPARPKSMNNTITITASVLNADGTPGKSPSGGPIQKAIDSVTVVSGLSRPEGTLFGIATSAASA